MKMKGVILAGGKGTRLYPLTTITNKHLLPVGKEPMIYNPIKQLISAGITEILIVTGQEHLGEIVRSLGSGTSFGCRLTFRVQDEPKGIAHALQLAEDFCYGSKLAVILGDNIATHGIRPYVQKYLVQGIGARVLLASVKDPERYGIAQLEEGRILRIMEKPCPAPSNYAVTGIYFYDESVFKIIKSLQPSLRGEWEISSVNNVYLDRGQLTYDLLAGHWIDAGTFESYKYANEMMFAINNQIIGWE